MIPEWSLSILSVRNVNGKCESFENASWTSGWRRNCWKVPVHRRAPVWRRQLKHTGLKCIDAIRGHLNLAFTPPLVIPVTAKLFCSLASENNLQTGGPPGLGQLERERLERLGIPQGGQSGPPGSGGPNQGHPHPSSVTALEAAERLALATDPMVRLQMAGAWSFNSVFEHVLAGLIIQSWP